MYAELYECRSNRISECSYLLITSPHVARGIAGQNHFLLSCVPLWALLQPGRYVVHIPPAAAERRRGAQTRSKPIVVRRKRDLVGIRAARSCHMRRSISSRNVVSVVTSMHWNRRIDKHAFHHRDRRRRRRMPAHLQWEGGGSLMQKNDNEASAGTVKKVSEKKELICRSSARPVHRKWKSGLVFGSSGRGRVSGRSGGMR